MATITRSNKDNYLLWEEVNGVLTLADLQEFGLPDRKINIPDSSGILQGDIVTDTLQGDTGTDTLIAE